MTSVLFTLGRYDAFVRAGGEAVYGALADYNGPRQARVIPYPYPYPYPYP